MYKDKLVAFLCLLMLLVFVFPENSTAAGIFNTRIEAVANDQFPLVEAYVSVSDGNGLPLEKPLESSAFRVMEDDVPVQGVKVERITNQVQALGVVLLMDVSQSMNSKTAPTPMNKSVEAAQYFVGELAGQDQVAVVKFSTTPVVTLDLSKAGSSQVRMALGELQPEGYQTSMYDALIEGIKLLKTFNGRRILVVVTDGKDTGTGLFDFESAMREAETNLVSVYPIGFGNTLNVDELKKMAALSGGVAQIQPNAFTLQNSFATLLNVLREQYKISYISKLPADDKTYKLGVSVEFQGGREEDSTNFIAKSGSIPLLLKNLQENQVIGGVVKFEPITTWPAPLKSMEVLMDGVRLSEISAPPFVFTWNTFADQAPIGNQNFVVKITDIAGNPGQVKMNLNVQPPITVEISSPTAGTTTSGHLDITAQVTSLAGITLDKVVFLIDQKEIGSVAASAGSPVYSIKWDSAGYGAGNHVISVKGVDTQGMFITEAKREVMVSVGSNSWMAILLVALGVAGVTTPLALRSRKRMGKNGAIQAVGVPEIQPAAAAQGARLRELNGLNPNQVWGLGGTELHLGRKQDENDVPLMGLNASRRHGVIRFENGLYVLYNVSNGNPILVNGGTVHNQHVLSPGDEITLGETILRFEI